jgi:cell division GTPase FtsZ
MAYLICGVGQAGGAIVDEMFESEPLRRVAAPLAINSTLKDLQSLRNIPRANWLGLSEIRGIVPGTTAGFEELVVGGFGKDPRLAQEVLGKNIEVLVQFFKDFAVKNTTQENLAAKPWEVKREGEEWSGVDEQLGSIPFALLVLGLGGGTGCGSSALIAQAIRKASAVTTSIIVLGVLPATHEATGEDGRGAFRQAWNALYAINELEKQVDGFILVDNERLAFTNNVEVLFPDFNRYVANAMTDLILGHLYEEVDPKKFERLSLPVIDIRDIVSAISFGSGTKARRPGFATLGWAAAPTKKLRGYLLPGLGDEPIDLAGLFQVALRKQSLQMADPQAAQKNLGMIRLPASTIKKKTVFPQTSLVEAELGKLTSLNETHFGITLGRRPLVSINTLFTYERHQLQRLKQLQELANRYSVRGVKGL